LHRNSPEKFFWGVRWNRWGHFRPNGASDFLKGVLKDTKVINIEVFTFRCCSFLMPPPAFPGGKTTCFPRGAQKEKRWEELETPSRLKRKEMGRARKHEGPLRPGELSADYKLNKAMIIAKLKREGDFKQCYCAFFPRLTPRCQCIQCPECIMKGRDFVNGMCQMCHCKYVANIHHTQGKKWEESDNTVDL
jgi:hypothetical protein